jgi:hypothetical protein
MLEFQQIFQFQFHLKINLTESLFLKSLNVRYTRKSDKILSNGIDKRAGESYPLHYLSAVHCSPQCSALLTSVQCSAELEGGASAVGPDW